MTTRSDRPNDRSRAANPERIKYPTPLNERVSREQDAFAHLERATIDFTTEPSGRLDGYFPSRKFSDLWDEM